MCVSVTDEEGPMTAASAETAAVRRETEHERTGTPPTFHPTDFSQLLL